MDPQILIPSGALPDREDAVPDNDRRGQQASFFDPLRYKLPENVRPFFEDRILVRRIDKPGPSDILAAPEKAEREKRGPQLGIVVALGPGATGRGILPGDDPNSIPKSERWRPFTMKWANFGADIVMGDRVEFQVFVTRHRTGKRVSFEVKVSDTIWYERMPDQEFMRDGELYTFLFEEQSVIGVVE